MKKFRNLERGGEYVCTVSDRMSGGGAAPSDKQALHRAQARYMKRVQANAVQVLILYVRCFACCSSSHMNLSQKTRAESQHVLAACFVRSEDAAEISTKKNVSLNTGSEVSETR